MKEKNPGRQARAEMGRAEAETEQRLSSNHLPRRYRLYDKIKDHVSLGSVNIVIAVTSLLIVALLVYGIMTAQPLN